MPTPFEIVGLADIVLRLGSKIYKFFKALKDAPQEIRDLCVEIESLQFILTDIESSAPGLDRAISRNANNFAPESMFICLKGCQAEFNTIWISISSMHPEKGLECGKLKGKLLKSVAWVLDADGIEKAIWRLERQKQTLALGMLQSGLKANKTSVEILSFLGYRVEENTATIVSHLDELEHSILLNLRQAEHRLLSPVITRKTIDVTLDWSMIPSKSSYNGTLLQRPLDCQ
ncbi:hypothetical protein EJ08DRAFT_471045 [Tothia fuscella]|uniref:NACHT-NTPase and P-loop NTPases N-terminal domain-containing protein n=1 Tax=Tothia fuscella TaxID=1048955 RepID=A0A9P4U331_9PEZI|nr:hypothetical protein EJ08DRAFT_471045 [Tothia fuscella]